MQEKSRNSKATIALIQSKISAKLYIAIILDGTPYKYWDLDQLGPAGVNFCKEIMKAYDLGYELETQFPTIIDGKKKIVPIEYRIIDEPGVEVSQNKTIMEKVAAIYDCTDEGHFYSETDEGMDIAVSKQEIPDSHSVEENKLPPENNVENKVNTPTVAELLEKSKEPAIATVDNEIPTPKITNTEPAKPKMTAVPVYEPISTPEPTVISASVPVPDVTKEISEEKVTKPSPAVFNEIKEEKVPEPSSAVFNEIKEEKVPQTSPELPPEAPPKGSVSVVIPPLDENAWTCINGHDNYKEYKFCHVCGAPHEEHKPEEKTETWVCSNGHVNKMSIKFCPDCGEAHNIEPPKDTVSSVEPKTWTCPNGHENEASLKFCPLCGAPHNVESPQVKTVIEPETWSCSNGHENPIGTKFCSYCGESHGSATLTKENHAETSVEDETIEPTVTVKNNSSTDMSSLLSQYLSNKR